MITTEYFPERLKRLRASLKLSQTELGNRIGVGRSSVNMYEKGTREPTLSNLVQLANIFSVSVDYLLGYEGSSNGSLIVLQNKDDEIARLKQQLDAANAKLETIKRTLDND